MHGLSEVRGSMAHRRMPEGFQVVRRLGSGTEREKFLTVFYRKVAEDSVGRIIRAPNAKVAIGSRSGRRRPIGDHRRSRFSRAGADVRTVGRTAVRAVVRNGTRRGV